MTHRLIIRAEAEANITDAAIWYQNQQFGLGEEFLAEVDTAMESAAANPHACAGIPKYAASLPDGFRTVSSSSSGLTPSSCFEFSTAHATIVSGRRPCQRIE